MQPSKSGKLMEMGKMAKNGVRRYEAQVVKRRKLLCMQNHIVWHDADQITMNDLLFWYGYSTVVESGKRTLFLSFLTFVRRVQNVVIIVDSQVLSWVPMYLLWISIGFSSIMPCIDGMNRQSLTHANRVNCQKHSNKRTVIFTGKRGKIWTEIIIDIDRHHHNAKPNTSQYFNIAEKHWMYWDFG